MNPLLRRLVHDLRLNEVKDDNSHSLINKLEKLIEKGHIEDAIARNAIFELVGAVENNILSYVQVEILLEKSLVLYILTFKKSLISKPE